MDNKVKSVLVTGATGMLGARLVYDLLEEGHLVRAIYRKKERIAQFVENVGYYTQNVDAVNKKIEWVQGDVLDYSTLFEALKGIDIVFHCAAMVSFYPPDKYTMHQTNITGTANLVNACLENGVKKYCQVSSIAALGKAENGALTNEETAWIPEKKASGYSISKFHSEMEVWRGMNEGLEAVVVNPSVILGPGEWHSGSPAFFNNIYKGMKFYTTGVTGYVDVRDVTKAMLLLTCEENWAQARSNRYLLNAANITYQELFAGIASSLNVKSPSIKASGLMLGLAWRMAWFFGKLTGKKPLITRHSTEAASRVSKFDGTKITNQFSFQYQPIDTTINEIGAMYLEYIKRRENLR